MTMLPLPLRVPTTMIQETVAARQRHEWSNHDQHFRQRGTKATQTRSMRRPHQRNGQPTDAAMAIPTPKRRRHQMKKRHPIATRTTTAAARVISALPSQPPRPLRKREPPPASCSAVRWPPAPAVRCAWFRARASFRRAPRGDLRCMMATCSLHRHT